MAKKGRHNLYHKEAQIVYIEKISFYHIEDLCPEY